MATLEVKGIEEHRKRLEEILTTSPGMERRLREAIREILKVVRGELSRNAASGLNMQSDPRKAYKAVRMAVYRKIFGGQVNILQSRHAGAGRYYEPPRHPSRRGGNRMSQSEATHRRMSYQGTDRGFILRFLNAGTNERESSIGNRGSISTRPWFGPRSQQEMDAASAKLQQLIDDIINEKFL